MKIDMDYDERKKQVKEIIKSKLGHHFGRTLKDASKEQLFRACAMAISDDIMDRWTKSLDIKNESNKKQIYYLSVEFLIGRSLGNNLMNMLREDLYRDALREIGVNLEELQEIEPDAGLGNGGLGRLAAAFMDSLTTLGFPVTGCSIRYKYGLFKQKIVDGYQVEMPDPWLNDGDLWEVPELDEQQEVRFGGKVTEYWQDGKLKIQHEGYHTIIATPYDVPVTGYNTPLVNNLRLWSAHSPQYLNLDMFDRGNYIKATEEEQIAEIISGVLYPEDNHYEGKALRLKQHYFFVSATIQNIVKNHKQKYRIEELPDKVAIHINDTHPSVAIPELMRILLDEEELSWDEAWDISTRTFSYTNHTILGEALERWPVSLFKDLLPRIYTILNEINERYCNYLWKLYPGEWDKISRMAIIAYDEIRMANLCVIGCHSINGVSVLHTEILKNKVFNDFYNIYPNRFCSITNGITQRRWLLHANPKLAELVNSSIGNKWIENSMELKNLEPYAEDGAFCDSFKKIRRENKEKLAKYILQNNNVSVDPDSIFDVHIKRLHEYKRQLLNVFHIMYLYNRLINNPSEDIYPRTFIFGAKASPGYHMAKLIIKLINTLAEKINSDKTIKDKIKVVFLEDYRISLAEKIIPASDISEQISTAGKEASGTGNMKFMLNGALTIGTLDGANIEMMEKMGSDNIFTFGLTAAEVNKYHDYGGYEAQKIYNENFALKTILDQLINGFFATGSNILFRDIYNSLIYDNDTYMVLKDFGSYIQTHEKAEKQYRQPYLWYKKAVMNISNSGYFSSDRSVVEYNDKIWHTERINNLFEEELH